MKRMITESFEHIRIKYDSEATIVCSNVWDIERLCPLKRPLLLCLFPFQLPTIACINVQGSCPSQINKICPEKNNSTIMQIYQPAQWSVCGNAFFIYLLLLGAFQGTHCTHQVAIHPIREAHPLARTEDFLYDTKISIQHDFEDGGPILILCCSNLQECITPPGSDVLTYGQVFTFFPGNQQETWWECHIL